jgi:hypothetical protein
LVWLAANGLGDIHPNNLSQATKLTSLRGEVKKMLKQGGKVNFDAGKG